MAKEGKARTNDLLITLITAVSIVLVVAIGSMEYFRIDLTTEKRHSVTAATEDVISELDDKLYIKVYLAGELPSDIEKLREASQYFLDEIKSQAPSLINYEFIDPNEDPDEKTRARIYQTLEEQGLKHSIIPIPGKGEAGHKIIFPGAIVTYKNNEVPIQLLRSETPRTDVSMITNSINNLEYEFVGGIREVISGKRKSVAIVQGHGELSEVQILDLSRSLEELYNVAWVQLDSQINSLTKKIEGIKDRQLKYDAIIVAKPTEFINKRDRYILDQYIMNGGKVLWMLDEMNANLDSLRNNQFSISTPFNLGLEDMLFAYGARLNKDIILDRSCSFIEVVTGQFGDRPQMERFPFFFEPVLVPLSGHPIVYNIDPIQCKFVGSLDTIGARGIKKTILLQSSEYSRIMKNPVRISLDIVNMKPDFKDHPKRNIAVLLEGEFTSPYTDRLPRKILDDPNMAFRDKSPATAMIIVSDGDIAENRANKELGYDRYLKRKIYGNKEFIINSLNYLLNDNSLITLRSRTITLRKLDPVRAGAERQFWQILNIGGPISICVILGLLMAWIRKKRYAS